MSQSLKLSDLGRSVEPLLEGPQVLAVCRNANARPLSACLESVDSPSRRRRVAGFLQSQPFPHYQPHPDRPGMLVRIDADGQGTVGRFVNTDARPSQLSIEPYAAARLAASLRLEQGIGQARNIATADLFRQAIGKVG